MAQLRSTKVRVTAAATVAAAALVGGLTALPAQAAPAEGRVLAAGSPTAVKDSFIVTLQQDAGFAASSTTGKDLIKEY
ncbi:S8 family peptidase, partial [Streptomyces sp. NPDC014773]